MLARLRDIPGLEICKNVPLSGLTRFGLGGPACVLADASTEEALAAALDVVRGAACPYALAGGGTNLIASDAGFPGAVLRYTANRIEVDDHRIVVEAGAVLQHLVDFSIARGLKGLETMTGIPGWTGGAVYGNAGAYGHSIQERIEWVRFYDGRRCREIGNAECDFRYRESVFKARKGWIVVAAGLRMEAGDEDQLRTTAEGILRIRNEKYPPSMRCAGSIFKNLLLADLPECVRAMIPPTVIREGKVPSAYFLEQVGAKGMANGPIVVAGYHANLIYNTGGGTARQLRELIRELKLRVKAAYAIELEEEVQHL
ncbi:MAG: UDP-N-acetylmuramate dehydrogenase [Bryobacterales bacterium]|nr:UDP-N-acetylmuramate dehydrogenase [Bryobacterales bacterium]MBV9397516.1 UDP-N-acetylmuramate dehydrogenase [Bryobacterales bacterium]